MSVERIIERILRDAEEQAQRARSAATDRAEQIEREAGQEAERQYAIRMEAGHKEITAEVARIIAQARMEAREILRTTREELLDRSFQKAQENLARIPESPQYPVIFERLFEEGVRSVGEPEVRVVVHSRDVSLARNIADRRRDMSFTISGQLEEAGGGLVIVSSSGTITVDNTFTGRLSRMHKDLVFRSAAVLFRDERR